MSITGPNYECIYAEVGTNGRVNRQMAAAGYRIKVDSLTQSKTINFLYQYLDVCLEVFRVLLGFIGVDAFAFKLYLTKPYLTHSIT